MKNIVATPALHHVAPGIQADMRIITPEVAQALLGRNTRNRVISSASLSTLRRALRNGEWRPNGEAVKIATNNDLLDGQHRLLAIVETGISMTTLVVTGLPPETQDTMDTGKSRSLRDILAIREEASPNGLAALVRRCALLEVFGLATAVSGFNSKSGLTIPEQLAWLERNPWVREYVNRGYRVAKHAPLTGALAAFLMIQFDNIDAEDSEFFWARTVDGVSLAEDSPIHALRRALDNLEKNVRGERSQRHIGALVIKAWNKYREGDPMRAVTFRSGGASPENFPEPR